MRLSFFKFVNAILLTSLLGGIVGGLIGCTRKYEQVRSWKMERYNPSATDSADRFIVLANFQEDPMGSGDTLMFITEVSGWRRNRERKNNYFSYNNYDTCIFKMKLNFRMGLQTLTAPHAARFLLADSCIVNEYNTLLYKIPMALLDSPIFQVHDRIDDTLLHSFRPTKFAALEFSFEDFSHIPRIPDGQRPAIVASALTEILLNNPGKYDLTSGAYLIQD